MKFALVGIGKWGQKYLNVIDKIKKAEVVATVSLTKNNYNLLLPKYQEIPNYSSIEELLTIKCFDTLIIASHPNIHFEMASKGLWHGKNVLCEKPCMFNDKEFRIIDNLCQSNIFYTNYLNLHHNVINKIENAIQLSDTKPIIRLVNIGNGPYRNGYSDLWDYGSHIFSIIFHLYPNNYFYIKNYEINEDGNHKLVLESREATIEAEFGNKGQTRIHSFECEYGAGNIFWENDGLENPLKITIEKFINNQLKTNLDLSLKIYDFLSKIEKLNSQFSE